MLTTKKLNNSVDPHEYIMTQLLCSKVLTIPGWNLITYEAVINLFKPQYPWLGLKMLRNHVAFLRRTMKPTKGSWLACLPAHDDYSVNGGTSASNRKIIREMGKKATALASSAATASVTPSKLVLYIYCPIYLSYHVLSLCLL